MKDFINIIIDNKEIVITILVMLVVFVILNKIIIWFRRLRYNFRRLTSASSILSNVLKSIEQEGQEEAPRSLRGMGNILLPNILKDFPDFNLELAKTKVKEEMRKRFSNENLKFHNVVIADYKKYGIQKVVVLQTAFEFFQGDKKVQKRYDIDYTYILESVDGNSKIAGNCPNCSAPLNAISSQVCEYCGTPIADIQGMSWKITDVRES